MFPQPATCWWEAGILSERGGWWENSRLAAKNPVIKSDWLGSWLGTLRGTRHSEHWEVAQHLVPHRNTPPVTHTGKSRQIRRPWALKTSVCGVSDDNLPVDTLKTYCWITVRECGRLKWMELNGIRLAELFPSGSSSSSATHVRSNQGTRTNLCLCLFLLAVPLNS